MSVFCITNQAAAVGIEAKLQIAVINRRLHVLTHDECYRDVTPTTCQSLVSVSPMIRVNGDTGVYHSSWTQLTGNRSSAQVAAEEVCDE
jgi:hypothetical protein